MVFGTGYLRLIPFHLGPRARHPAFRLELREREREVHWKRSTQADKRQEKQRERSPGRGVHATLARREKLKLIAKEEVETGLENAHGISSSPLALPLCPSYPSFHGLASMLMDISAETALLFVLAHSLMHVLSFLLQLRNFFFAPCEPP